MNSFRADDHVERVIHKLGDQLVEPSDAGNALRKPGLGQPPGLTTGRRTI